MASVKRSAAALKPSKILKTVKDALAEEEPQKWLEALKGLQKMAEGVDSRYHLKTIVASSINTVTMACRYTGVSYIEGDADHEWLLAPLAIQDSVQFGTTWLEAALTDLYKNSLWPIDCCEALVRTSLDLILYDRLKLLGSSEAVGIRKLTLQGEFPITTSIVDGTTDGDRISGKVDYAIGHTASEKLEVAMIAIEAKIPSTFYQAVTQLIVYLAGLQQRKAERKLVCNVYGFAMDGLGFEFFRLDEDRILKSSGRLRFNNRSENKLIFQFIDHILQTALRASPHTTPEKTFPTSASKWQRKVEAPRFLIFQKEGKDEVDDWAMEITDDEDDEQEIISCGTPSKKAILIPRKT